MKIVTFGSCLSRHTALKYVRLFGGEIVSSVYHNRSDAFLARFIDRIASMYSYEEILSMLVPNQADEASPDDNSVQLVSNQYEPYLGLHRLEHGVQLFKALESPGIDLIIVDNYNDLKARMMVRKDDPDIQLFLRPRDLKNPEEWELGPGLGAEEGAADMSRILNLLKDARPEAAVVFINWPYSSYILRDESPDRLDKMVTYEKALTFSRGVIIPCLEIRRPQLTANPQHFTPDQYCAYAGWVHSYVAAQAAREDQFEPEAISFAA